MREHRARARALPCSRRRRRPRGSSPRSPRRVGPAAAEAYYHFSLGLQARWRATPTRPWRSTARAQKLDPGAGAIRAEIARAAARDRAASTRRWSRPRRGGPPRPRTTPHAHLLLAQLYRPEPGAERRRGGPDARPPPSTRRSSRCARRTATPCSRWPALRQLQDHKAAAARAGSATSRSIPATSTPTSSSAPSCLAWRGREGGRRAARARSSCSRTRPAPTRSSATIYAGAEQTDQAVLHYRKALEIEPDDVRRAPRARRGALAGEAGRRRRWPRRTPCSRPTPQNRFALDLKGRCLRELRRFDEAEAVADTLLARRPERPQGRVPEGDDRRVAARLRGGRGPARGGARSAARRGRRSTPATSACSCVHLGFAYQQLGRYADAAEAFARACLARRSARREPPELPRRGALPREAEGRGARRGAGGRASASPTTSTSPASRRRCCARRATRAAADARGGDAAASRRRTRRCCRAWPTSTVAPSSSPQAEATLRDARRLEPKNLSVLFQLGAVLERQKRHDDAEAVFREALAIEPDSAPVLNYLGYMNADRGVRVEEALALIQKAVDPRPRQRSVSATAWAGPSTGSAGSSRPRSRSARPSRRTRTAPSSSTTSATCSAGAGASPKRVGTGGRPWRARTRRASSTARGWRRRSVMPRESQAQQRGATEPTP